MTPPAMLPFCSAAPTPCSPFSPVTPAAHAGARALRTSALRSYADPLLAQALPDRPLLTDSSILSPYATTPDDIVRGFASAELPSSDDALWPHLTPVAAADDAAQRALLDAPIPTAFPADASEAEQSFARFVDNLSRQIFQAEDALTEGYDKLRLSAYDALAAYRKTLRGVAIDLRKTVTGATTSVTILASGNTPNSLDSGIQPQINRSGQNLEFKGGREKQQVGEGVQAIHANDHRYPRLIGLQLT